MRGKFVVFEGPNGCGKGTQLERLHNYIVGSGKAVPVFTTGEPNDFDENGRMAREILKRDGDPYENAVGAVRCFAENRKVHNSIFSSLLNAHGVNVLSDRYWHSNFAFQHAQGVSYEKIAEKNRGLEVPDLTILLDVSVEESFWRLGKRDVNRRKFDRDFEFMEKVRENYLELSGVLPSLMNDESIVVVDGVGNEEGVWERVKEVYDGKFETPLKK